MQNGSLIRASRLRGTDVWEYRWREPGPVGKLKHRRLVIGSVDQFTDRPSAMVAVAALRREINLALSRASCAKIRNLMSVLFNHGIRHQLYDRNPIQLVRQSAKRRRIPEILSAAEVQKLLRALSLREYGAGRQLIETKWHGGQSTAMISNDGDDLIGPLMDPCKRNGMQQWRAAANPRSSATSPPVL